MATKVLVLVRQLLRIVLWGTPLDLCMTAQ